MTPDGYIWHAAPEPPTMSEQGLFTSAQHDPPQMIPRGDIGAARGEPGGRGTRVGEGGTSYGET